MLLIQNSIHSLIFIVVLNQLLFQIQSNGRLNSTTIENLNEQNTSRKLPIFFGPKRIIILFINVVTTHQPNAGED